MSRWTGPRDSDWSTPARERLRAPVPADRWPYGPPDEHQEGCILHEGGLFCDCAASAADSEDEDDRFVGPCTCPEVVYSREALCLSCRELDARAESGEL